MFDELSLNDVYCVVCGKRHFPDEETFLTFYGNVTIGLNGVIIGHNFNDEEKLCGVQYVCRDLICVQKLYKIENLYNFR